MTNYFPISPRWCVYYYGMDAMEYYEDELQALRVANWVTENTMKHQAQSEYAPIAPAIAYPVNASGERMPVGPAYYYPRKMDAETCTSS